MIGFCMTGFCWFVAIVAVIIQLSLDTRKKKKEIRRKERLISDFVDQCIENDTLYPIGHHWESSPYGFFPGSSSTAAAELSLDENEAYCLILNELKKRGLPASRPI